MLRNSNTLYSDLAIFSQRCVRSSAGAMESVWVLTEQAQVRGTAEQMCHSLHFCARFVSVKTIARVSISLMPSEFLRGTLCDRWH